MANDEPKGNPLDIARKVIQLITRSISNVNGIKSLAFVNSMSELDFELNLALLELGNEKLAAQDCERLRQKLHPLFGVLGTLTTKELRALVQEVASLRRDHPSMEPASDPGLCHGYARKSHGTINEGGWHEGKVHRNSSGRPDEDECLSHKEKAAKEFMQQARRFYVDNIESLERKKAIKVAVLDTGVDKKHRYFKRKHGTCFKEIATFMDCDSHDTFGHGTAVAGLIVKLAPHADLFIAKICRDRIITGVDQYVEAINWAMKHDVHIINISSSVDEDGSIEDAISKAEAQGIVVFAAASDDEANKPRPFPARMEKVLAVHSTDGRGNISFQNPKPLDDDMNISTLGESIESPVGDGELLDGSSYATAIASGMAANILTLADAYLSKSKDDQEIRRRVFKREGMKRIFRHVSGGRDREGYNYVCPEMVAEDCNSSEVYRHWFKQALKSR
ncbi:extracellular serine protease [Fusarium flagelliforme]|uniref:Extracellular serine protease n=1 Tax=Fusarium flagelliforme TaxID=2675880 RepID=A0A395MBS8_9HYPO|nr:extracellular serine protease [Fusarium flagelliforme]